MKTTSDLDSSSLAASLLKTATDAIGGANTALLLFILVLVCLGLLIMLWRMWSLIKQQRTSIKSLTSQLHGARVRRGYASEALAPLLETFPVPVGKAGTTTLFVGQPVDYIHFDEEAGVTFVEIKSGSAQLSTRQRRLRELIERGAVAWKTMNIGTN